MNEHVSANQLDAMADGELIGDELFEVQEHLAECAACTSAALAASLTKGAAARAGMRHAVPDDFKERMRRLAAGERSIAKKSIGFGAYAWGSIAALLLLSVGLFVAQREMQGRAASEALVAEVADQHVTAMAGNAPPEVLSSDRHTVKPWFQGKLPFSFNLPENLPEDTKLDGANLAYLRNRPVAQLLYSIGRHRVSVLVRQKQDGAPVPAQTERSGFHVTGFGTYDLEVVAISDVDPARLSALVRAIEQAQTKH